MRAFALLALLIVTSSAHAIVVSGTITRLSDGQPAVGAEVTLVQQTTPFSQVTLGVQTVGANGAYAFSFPNTGSFYVRVALAPFLPAEEFLQFLSGSPPAVLNTALSAPSTITAVVRDAVTQAPLAGVPVVFYRLPNNFPSDAVTDAQGRASLGGVAGGDYRVCARSLTDSYIDECQDGQQLPLDGALGGIVPRLVGSGVTLELPIALDVGASLTGRITDRYFGVGASAPIRFEFFDAAGTFLDSTDLPLAADGAYAMAGLPTGTYRIAAQGFGANYYTRRVYPNLDCDNCNVTIGTAITVGGQQVVPNIDFALHPGVVVTGTVRQSGTLLPIQSATVRAYRQLVFPPGWAEEARGQTGADGTYRIAHLGYNQVRAAASAVDHFAQQYGGTVCYFANACGNGTTLPATVDQVLTGVDFVLSPGGTITATVRGETTGGPLASDVWIQSADGALLYSQFEPGGTHRTFGLPPGTYYAAASRFRNNVRECEVWQNQPCLAGNPIDPATATPIVVGASGTQAIELTLPNDDLLSNGFE